MIIRSIQRDAMKAEENGAEEHLFSSASNTLFSWYKERYFPSNKRFLLQLLVILWKEGPQWIIQ